MSASVAEARISHLSAYGWNRSKAGRRHSSARRLLRAARSQTSCACRRIRSTRCRPTRSGRRPRSCAATAASATRWRFASIELREPAKAAVRDFAPGDADRARGASSCCWNRADGQAYKARRRRSAATASPRWEHRPGVQPNMTVDEYHECDEVLRARPAT